MQRPPVLIVGASGAIGSALAEQLSGAGYTVWGTASHLASTAVVPNCVSKTFVCDLTNDASIADLIDQLSDSTAALSGVILAAGAVAFGNLSDTKTEVVDRLMAVNLTGQVKLMSALQPLLKAAGEGFVVSLSGKVAEVPTAGMAAYSAAKAGLYAYSVAAGRELRRDGIRWIDARPGHTETGFAERALSGTAPAFGPGLAASAVAARIVAAISGGEKDLPSSEFAN